jgi:pyruvate/2-oxoacid:ferredoxin oxidoreductase alpha subunit
MSRTVADILREKNGYQRFDNKVRKEMNPFAEFIKSSLRHGLSGAGAVLVSMGIVGQEVVDQAAYANTEIIVGSALFFGGPLISTVGGELLGRLLNKKK